MAGLDLTASSNQAALGLCVGGSGWEKEAPSFHPSWKQSRQLTTAHPSADSHEKICRYIAKGGELVVVSVG